MSLKHVEGKVIIEIDIESKNWHTFANGLKIRLERQYENLNRRITEPVNATVISAKDIPAGVEILIHPNAIIESNRIYNYKKLTGENADIQYYSIREDQCFLWRDEDDNWQPLPPYETALRIFKPYEGILLGIEPTLIKDVLYVTSGELKGKCVHTLKSCDYEVVFQDVTGREGRIIRFRPNGDEKHKREPEAVAISHEITDKVNEGMYYVGLTKSDCKTIMYLRENSMYA